MWTNEAITYSKFTKTLALDQLQLLFEDAFKIYYEAYELIWTLFDNKEVDQLQIDDIEKVLEFIQ